MRRTSSCCASSVADLRPVRCPTRSAGGGVRAEVLQRRQLRRHRQRDQGPARRCHARGSRRRRPRPEAPCGRAGLGDLARTRSRCCAPSCSRSIRRPWRFILSRIDSEAAAGGDRSFPAGLPRELLCRMLGIKVSSRGGARRGGELAKDCWPRRRRRCLPGIADILNRLDKKQSEAVLQSLAEVRPDEAKALKSCCSRFEDLADCCRPGRARRVRPGADRAAGAWPSRAPTAGSRPPSSPRSPPARGAWWRPSCRARRNAPARDIAEARRAIVDTVLKMSAKGDIAAGAAMTRTASGQPS